MDELQPPERTGIHPSEGFGLMAQARAEEEDGYMSCPCGRGDYHLCTRCPYSWCSVHGDGPVMDREKDNTDEQ